MAEKELLDMVKERIRPPNSYSECFPASFTTYCLYRIHYRTVFLSSTLGLDHGVGYPLPPRLPHALHDVLLG